MIVRKNQGTQQNAATVDLLGSQVQDLTKAVSAFKLSGASGEELRRSTDSMSMHDGNTRTQNENCCVLNDIRQEHAPLSDALPPRDPRRMLPPGGR